MTHPLQLASAVALAVAVAALVWSEVRGRRLGVWIAKPLASTFFVAAAWVAGAPASAYGRWVLLALVLSWLGDVCLIGRRTSAFAAGLASFLLAHLAFAVAFLHLPQAYGSLAVGAVAMTAVGWVVLRWLWPHLPAKLRPAVALYVAAITLMVALAAGTVAVRGAWLAAAAAVFAASDILVARHRFVAPSPWNKIVGLPLYYAAQWVFAWSCLLG